MHYRGREGMQSNHEPRKTDLRSLIIHRMTSKSIKPISVPHATSPSLYNSVSTSSILISENKYLAFTFTKSCFPKNLHMIKNVLKHKERSLNCYSKFHKFLTCAMCINIAALYKDRQIFIILQNIIFL